MQTPKDVDVVSLFVATDGVAKFDYLGRVLPDGTLSLPSTLALVQPDNPNAQVHLRVAAFQTQGPQENARVLRDVLTTVPTAGTALLRLPLDFLDDGSGQGTLPAQYVPEGVDSAPDGLTQFDPTTMITSSCDPMNLCETGSANCLTMINGVCGSATVNSSTLPAYTQAEVFGDGGFMASGAPTRCFNVESCFQGATPVPGVGGGTCSFTLPGTSGGAAVTVDASAGSNKLPVDAEAPAETGTSTGGCTSAADCSAGMVCCTVLGGLSTECLSSEECSLGGILSPDGGASSGEVATLNAPIQLGPALNVALVTPSTGACLSPGQCYVPLPNDPNEGFTVQGSTVTLAPGVCNKLGNTVMLAVSSGACPTETLSEPVCEPTTPAEVAEAGLPPVADAAACDGNYVVTCLSSAACGSDSGGSTALTVSGSQATLYAPMNGSQIVPIAGTLDTVTCVATITLQGSEGGSCDSAGGIVMAALTSGASFAVPCSNGGSDGSCVQGTMSCTVARGTLDGGSSNSCPTGSINCGGTCTDRSIDPNNCGACGNVCQGTESCTQGSCAQLVDGGGPSLDATMASDATTTTCAPPGTICNGTCVNEQMDPNNCGTCGFACPSSQSCVSGACTPPATSDASAAVCTPGSQQCQDNGVETCGSNGQWGSPATCGGTTPDCSSGFCGSITGTSCQTTGAGLNNCGANSESCCTSLEVPGGTYYRTYNTGDSTDGGPPDGGWTDEADPATVSGFRLDKYLVTVGRFRQFVNAVLPDGSDGGLGWLPAEGSGIHTHLNGGLGLVSAGVTNSDGGAEYETGWDAVDWNNTTDIDPTNSNLTCGGTWTPTAGSQENLPINCVTWYEAYAFCIWDGGFLPSEAEWEYAAAGGSQQREYPWGSTAPGTGNQYAIYDGYYAGSPPYAPVGAATLGAGLWGQLDLAGDAFEWNLDYWDDISSYVDPCADCANFTSAPYRVSRGGNNSFSASWMLPPTRDGFTPTARNNGIIGFRCARVP
jgi:formylglycine-generating enzyme required for sulfatase activity